MLASARENEGSEEEGKSPQLETTGLQLGRGVLGRAPRAEGPRVREEAADLRVVALRDAEVLGEEVPLGEPLLHLHHGEGRREAVLRLGDVGGEKSVLSCSVWAVSIGQLIQSRERGLYLATQWCNARRRERGKERGWGPARPPRGLWRRSR